MKTKFFIAVFVLLMTTILGACSELVMQEEFDEIEMNNIVEDSKSMFVPYIELVHECWEEKNNGIFIPCIKWGLDTEIEYDRNYEYIIMFKIYREHGNKWFNFGNYKLRDLTDFNIQATFEGYSFEKEYSDDESGYITAVATVYKRNRRTGQTSLIKRCPDPILMWRTNSSK